MTKYVIRLQKIGSNKVSKRICSTSNISNLVKLLGGYGYHIVNYYEYDESDILLVNCEKGL